MQHAVQPARVEGSTHSEAMEVLTAMASRKREVASLAELLATRALQVTAGGDFGVARDAMEALMRRLASAGDVVVRRVEDGYRATRKDRGTRGAYEVWLADADEVVGSCSCPDYGKAALGLCKHLLAVARLPRRKASSSPRALRWDPVRPLTGPGDRLARLWLDPRVRAPARVAALFQDAPGARPIEPAAIEGAQRRVTIEALLAACRKDPRFAEPAVAPMLLGLLAGEAPRGGEFGRREVKALLRGLKQRLFPYQLDGVARFLGVRRLLLADDMGLGKTAQAIAACHALVARGDVRRAVVVTPAALKPQWLREWQAFTDVGITLVEGMAEERERLYRRRADGVLLVNYEQLLRDLPHVQRFAPELVILDEAQRIKNWETRTAAVVKQLDPPWRLVLTGTPMENRLEELSSVMEWVDEHALEPRWRLASWHAVRADGTREVIGARNLETLRTRLAPSMLRRVRHEVLAQLPARTDTHVPVTMTEEQQLAHDDLNAPIARLASTGARRPLTQAEFLKLMTLLAQQRMICNALALRDFAAMWPALSGGGPATSSLVAALGSPKLVDLRERIFELAVTQGRKVVVFSQWRRMLQLAAWVCGDVLERAGARAVFFTGQESARRRTENLVAFHDDPATRVLFASDAGGVGLNLQRAASCCINLELPWNPAVLEQRIGRVFRLGQTQPVEVYNYVALGGIEERIGKLVGDKRALFSGLFDGTSDEVPFDSSGSFLSRVNAVLPAVTDAARTEAEDAPEDGSANADGDAEDTPEAATTAAAPSAADSERPDATATSSVAIADLVTAMSALQARPLGDGRIALELPAAAATGLGALLRGLAAAIEAGAR